MVKRRRAHYVKQCLACRAWVPTTAWKSHRGSHVCAMRQERRRVKTEKLVLVPSGNPKRLFKELQDLGVEAELLAISAESGYMGTVDRPRRGVHVAAPTAALLEEAMTLWTMTGPRPRKRWTLWAKSALASGGVYGINKGADT